MMFVEVDGGRETREKDGLSVVNPAEARAAVAAAAALLEASANGDASNRIANLASDIGIIAPYAAQVRAIKRLLPGLQPNRRTRFDAPPAPDSMEALEVSTVDGFQGREKDAVVLSATRSNEKGDVGFLADARRMNVAVTRARMHCVLVCDTDTVGRHDAFLRRLVAHFEARGEYVAASEFDDD